jgi:bifunctional ADP-heptose synthase (sugar kinase/adenylyltransferase)
MACHRDDRRAAGISRRARTLIDKFSSRRITVVGDVMLDRFLIGRVSTHVAGGSSRGGVRSRRSASAAPNVANNLRAAARST